MAEQLANDALTTLASGIGASDTSLTVTSATGFPTSGNFRIRIDNEILLVTAVAGTTFTVNRGQEGTTAAPHSAGATVAQVLTVEGLTQWRRDGWDLGHVKNTTANLPAALYPGRLFLPTDGAVLYRDSGSVWEPWGPLFPFKSPVDSDFVWVNQGTASVSTVNGGIFLSTPAEASLNMRIRKKAAPATPYTITIYMVPVIQGVNYNKAGLVWRDSSTGRLVAFHMVHSTTLLLAVDKFNSPTSFNATYTTVTLDKLAGRDFFLRIRDDGTNRICSYSWDGVHFIQLHSIGRTDFLTANEVGFEVGAESATSGAGMWLLSWREE